MRIDHIASLLAILPTMAWLGCGGGETARDQTAPDIEETMPAAPDLISPGPHDVAVLKIRDLGSIRFELLPELAPITVAHFSKLVRQGYYAGTTFHRVVPGFMIQGGDPNSRDADPRNDGKGGGTGIKSEFSDVPHVRGIVSLANRGNPDTGGSQFFIVHADSPHLNGGFSVFGRVIEGIEVVDAITEVEIDTYGRYGPQARPHPVDVVIESIEIEPANRNAL